MSFDYFSVSKTIVSAILIFLIFLIIKKGVFSDNSTINYNYKKIYLAICSGIIVIAVVLLYLFIKPMQYYKIITNVSNKVDLNIDIKGSWKINVISPGGNLKFVGFMFNNLSGDLRETDLGNIKINIDNVNTKENRKIVLSVITSSLESISKIDDLPTHLNDVIQLQFDFEKSKIKVNPFRLSEQGKDSRISFLVDNKIQSYSPGLRLGFLNQDKIGNILLYFIKNNLSFFIPFFTFIFIIIIALIILTLNIYNKNESHSASN